MKSTCECSTQHTGQLGSVQVPICQQLQAFRGDRLFQRSYQPFQLRLKSVAEKRISFSSLGEQRHGDWIVTTSSCTCGVPGRLDVVIDKWSARCGSADVCHTTEPVQRIVCTHAKSVDTQWAPARFFRRGPLQAIYSRRHRPPPTEDEALPHFDQTRTVGHRKNRATRSVAESAIANRIDVCSSEIGLSITLHPSDLRSDRYPICPMPTCSPSASGQRGDLRRHTAESRHSLAFFVTDSGVTS